MSKQKLEKFTPTIREEKAVKIDTNYKSKLDEIADKDGKIETQLNKESMIQAVSHKLYRNAESGFRELLNNEFRACQIAKDKHGKKPYLKVSLNTLDRKLTIQGFNSQGITEEVFAKILREIGTSTVESKKDGRIPFGMGFFGFLKLSDIAFVQTRCAENNDCYGFMAKGGLFFQKIQKPKFKETGTKIWLTLKEKTNYEKLITTLEEVSKTSGIKTYFELNAHKGNILDYGSGIHELEQTSISEIFNKFLDKENDSASYLKSTINNDEIEAHLAIGIDKYGDIDNSRNKQLFLINSPIKAILDEEDYDDYDYDSENDQRVREDDDYDYDGNEKEQELTYKASKIDDIKFSYLVVNMKNELKYPPHQDRERLTPNAEKRLREVVIQLYIDAIKNLKPCYTLKDWQEHEHKYFISSNEENLPDLHKLLDKKTLKLNKALNEKYWVGSGKTKEQDLKELVDTNEKKTKYFYIQRKDSRVIRTLEENLDDYEIVVIHVNKDEILRRLKSKYEAGGLLFEQVDKEEKRLIKLLESFTFKEGKKYIKDNGLKLTRVSNDESTYIPKEEREQIITLHNKHFDQHKSTLEISSGQFKDYVDNESVYKVKNLNKYREIIRNCDGVYLVNDEPTNDKIEDLITVDQIYEKIKNKTYFTNHGYLTLDELLKKKRNSCIKINYNNENTPRYFTKLTNFKKQWKTSGSGKNKTFDYIVIISDKETAEKSIKKAKQLEEKQYSKPIKNKPFSKNQPEPNNNSTLNPNHITSIKNRIEKDLIDLSFVLMSNDFEEVMINKSGLDSDYSEYLENLAEKYEELLGQDKDSWDNDVIDESQFDDTFQFERYLNVLKQIDEQIKNPELRDIWTIHTQHDFENRFNQIINLNKIIGGKK